MFTQFSSCSYFCTAPNAPANFTSCFTPGFNNASLNTCAALVLPPNSLLVQQVIFQLSFAVNGLPARAFPAAISVSTVPVINFDVFLTTPQQYSPKFTLTANSNPSLFVNWTQQSSCFGNNFTVEPVLPSQIKTVVGSNTLKYTDNVIKAGDIICFNAAVSNTVNNVTLFGSAWAFLITSPGPKLNCSNTQSAPYNASFFNNTRRC